MILQRLNLNLWRKSLMQFTSIKPNRTSVLFGFLGITLLNLAIPSLAQSKRPDYARFQCEIDGLGVCGDDRKLVEGTKGVCRIDGGANFPCELRIIEWFYKGQLRGRYLGAVENLGTGQFWSTDLGISNPPRTDIRCARGYATDGKWKVAAGQLEEYATNKKVEYLRKDTGKPWKIVTLDACIGGDAKTMNLNNMNYQL